jgi:hypothetical protein
MARPRRERADDLEAVRLFLDRAARVESSTVVRHSVGTHLTVNWSVGQPWTWTTTEPTPDVLKSLLMDLRPLVVPGESINLRAIFSIGERRLQKDEHRRALREGATAWNNAHRQGAIALKVNERDLSPERVMDLWINGYYFHEEPRKRAELEALVPEAGILTRHMFMEFVYRSIECVIWTASVLRAAKEKGAL